MLVPRIAAEAAAARVRFVTKTLFSSSLLARPSGRRAGMYGGESWVGAGVVGDGLVNAGLVGAGLSSSIPAWVWRGLRSPDPAVGSATAEWRLRCLWRRRCGSGEARLASPRSGERSALCEELKAAVGAPTLTSPCFLEAHRPERISRAPREPSPRPKVMTLNGDLATVTPNNPPSPRRASGATNVELNQRGYGCN